MAASSPFGFILQWISYSRISTSCVCTVLHRTLHLSAVQIFQDNLTRSSGIHFSHCLNSRTIAMSLQYSLYMKQNLHFQHRFCRCGTRSRGACTSSRAISAVSRQAEAPSDGRRATGSSSTCASRCSLTSSSAEKRSRCPCVATGRRRLGAAHSFCHASAQPLHLWILPAPDKLRTGRQNQCLQHRVVEPGSTGMSRAAVRRVPLHRHHLHRAAERQHSGGQVHGKFCAILVYIQSIV